MRPRKKYGPGVDHFQRTDQKLSARSQSADAFIALHPEFFDTQENGQAMNRTLQALYGDIAFTPGHFEQAYAVLKANDALDLDQSVIVQMEQAAADQRAQATREQRARETRVYSEEERYTMDLDELRRLETREIQQRNQLAAERGGNGW